MKKSTKNNFSVKCKTRRSRYFFVCDNSLLKFFEYLKPLGKNLRITKFANFYFRDKIHGKTILAKYTKLESHNILLFPTHFGRHARGAGRLARPGGRPVGTPGGPEGSARTGRHARGAGGAPKKATLTINMQMMRSKYIKHMLEI